MPSLQDIPVELVAEILAELDLHDLICVSSLSPALRKIAADPALNPWRRPILRRLRAGIYDHTLAHLSLRLIVPRQNWIEILSLARPAFVLYDATVPKLLPTEWEECFARRFLPGWRRWKKDGSWKEAFLKILYRVWHRPLSSCTSDESWTKYIVLNRNGSASELEGSSRSFNPFAIFDEMKAQANLAHLETHVRVVLELVDVRILAFGTLSQKTPLIYNQNAHAFLHPPGIEGGFNPLPAPYLVHDHGVYPMKARPNNSPDLTEFDYTYTRLRHPTPSPRYANYPFFTPGESDRRWNGSGEAEEGGRQWVGGMMIISQLLSPHDRSPSQQYASFIWNDLLAIAPWLEERVTKKINGPGLGI
ncbi:hypothetical protein AX15_007210 [Amanita polypyramis BW_CC]|nr:hypothetical protein AX15_007210 [Amanita polypyramis BW_CC]